MDFVGNLLFRRWSVSFNGTLMFLIQQMVFSHMLSLTMRCTICWIKSSVYRPRFYHQFLGKAETWQKNPLQKVWQICHELKLVICWGFHGKNTSVFPVCPRCYFDIPPISGLAWPKLFFDLRLDDFDKKNAKPHWNDAWQIIIIYLDLLHQLIHSDISGEWRRFISEISCHVIPTSWDPYPQSIHRES